MIDKKPIINRIQYARDHMPFMPEYLKEFSDYTGITDSKKIEEEGKDRGRGLEISMEFMERLPFYTLEEALIEFKPLYLGHNSDIIIALPFEQVVTELNAHKNPEEIKVCEDDRYKDILGIIYRRGVTLYDPDQHTFISDETVTFPSLFHKFIEYLFNLESGTFGTEIIQAGKGARLNSRSRLSKFMHSLVEREIPTIVNKAGLKRHSLGDEEYYKNMLYLINGIKI